MKKKTIMATACAALLWLAAGLVDYSRVHAFERPLFCICTEPLQDGGSGKYRGLGYSFAIEGNFMPDDEFPGVTKWTFSLFGIEVQSEARE